MFSNVDSDIVSNFGRVVAEVLPICEIKTYGQCNHQISNKAAVEDFHTRYSLDYCRSEDKRVTKYVRAASKEAQTAFIRAYFDCDGTFQSAEGRLQISSASLGLLRDVQLMLLNFGVYARIMSSYNKVYERDYYDLDMCGQEAINYLQTIGFNKNSKCDAIVEVLSSWGSRTFNPNLDSLPHLGHRLRSLYESISPDARSRALGRIFDDVTTEKCDLTYERLTKILTSCVLLDCDLGILRYLEYLSQAHFIYARVESVSSGEAKTYDFTLPETHSFLSNGFVSHNSSFALRCCGQCQKSGDIPYWVDLEQNLAKDGIAEINGVDMDKIFIPNIVNTKLIGDEKSKDAKGSAIFDAGTVLDMIYDVASQGVFNPIVLDSLATLIPEKEMQAESFNDNSMMDVARLMSKALKQIVGILAAKNVSLILINQERVGIKNGVTVTTTPGGNAPKFFASQRIRLSKVFNGQIYHAGENGKELAGHYAKVNIVKNRCAAPYDGEIQIPIYYKEYFPDDAQIVFELACKMQVIRQTKGIYTYKQNDQVIFKAEGAAGALDIVRKQLLVGRLAADCVTAEKAPRNVNLTNPVKVPQSVVSLASGKPANICIADDEDAASNVEESKHIVFDNPETLDD